MSQHRRLGGTSIAALLGEDSFGKTPWDIYRWVVLGERGAGNRYMARGSAVEPIIRDRYCTETGATLDAHPGVVEWGECFAASVDDLSQREGAKVVDYKSASNSDSNKRKWAKGMPSSYAWQGRLYMEVFQRPQFDLFVAFGKDIWNESDGSFAGFTITETKLYTIDRDQELMRPVLDTCVRFWREHVIPRVPPAGAPVREERLPAAPLTAAELEALDALTR